MIFMGDASILSTDGIAVKDYLSNLAPIKASELHLDSNSITFQGGFFNFGGPSGLLPLQVQSIYFNSQGTPFNLETQGAELFFNGNKVLTSNFIPSFSSSNFTNINVESLNLNSVSTITNYGKLINLSSIDVVDAVNVNSGGGVASFVCSDSNGSFQIQNNDTVNIKSAYDSTNLTYQLQLSNVSTINGMPYGGGGGVSSITNWSYFPVNNSNASFGNNSIWFAGAGGASFTNVSGNDMLPVMAKQFDIYNINYPDTRASLTQDTDGTVAIMSPYTLQPSALRVSTLSISTSVISADSSNLYVNGVNPVSNWSQFPPTSQFMAPLGVSVINPFANPAFSATNSNGFFTLGILTNGDTSFNCGGGNIQMITNSLICGNTSFDNNSVNTVSTNTSSIQLNTVLLTGSNNNLYIDGVAVNTDNSITNWSEHDAISIVNSSYGFNVPSGGTEPLTLISGHNFLHSVSLGLTAGGNGLITAPGNFVIDAPLTSIGDTFITTDTITTTNIGATTVNISSLPLTTDGTNLVFGGSPLAYQVSYPAVALGTYVNYAYTNVGNFDIPTGFINFQPQYNYAILSLQVIFPRTLIQNNSNFFVYGLQKVGLTKTIYTNAVLPVDGGTFTFAPQIEIFCDFTGNLGTNFGFRFNSSVAGSYSFYNAQIKYLPS